MALHVYVDESKTGRYIIAAVIVDSGRVSAARQAMRLLLLPRQRRIHFRDERDSRKSVIIETLLGLPLEARIYVTDRVPSQVEARRRCLVCLLEEVAPRDARELIIEQDEGMLCHDKQTLAGATRKLFPHRSLNYQWLSAHQEPMLWASDAFAWCWAAGGGWQRRVSGSVEVTEA